MSVFVSQVHADGVHLHTDAGWWNLDDGTLAAIRGKAMCSPAGLVVTMIGGAAWRTRIYHDLCGMADDLGVAETLVRLQVYACSLRDEYGKSDDWRDGMQVLVAGYVPGKGGVHRYLQTNDFGRIEAYKVYTPDPLFYRGPHCADYTPARLGLMQREGESDDAWRRRQGLELVEHMRTISDIHPSGHVGHFVGGRCDLTTINAAGVTQETVKEWSEDKVGRPVRPRRAASN